MVRFSVSLDEEQNKWVEQKAEELNGSKTQVVSMVVDMAREEEIPLTRHPTSDFVEDDEPVGDHLESLEKRIEKLESAIRNSSEKILASSSEPHSVASSDSTEPQEPQESDSTKPTASQTESASASNAEHTDPPGPTPSASTQEMEEAATEKNVSETSRETGLPSAQNEGVKTHDDQEEVAESESGSGTNQDSTASANQDSTASGFADESDPELRAVRQFVSQQPMEVATDEEVVECWEFLKRRGTAGPRAFKKHCDQANVSDDAELEVWWTDDINPVLIQLPGVEPPEEGGTFLRYRY